MTLDPAQRPPVTSAMRASVVVFLVQLIPAHSQAAGPAPEPLLREGDFAYTRTEGSQCAQDLQTLQLAKQSTGPDYGEVKLYRDRFQGCVLNLRKHVQDDKDRASASQQAKVAAAAADAERKAQADAEAERRNKIRLAAIESVKDPRAAQEVLSALLCGRLAERADVMAEIAKDKRYSQIGGVVNLRRRAELQDEVAAIDDAIKGLRDELRELKRPVKGCKDKGVAFLVRCFIAESDDRDCGTPVAVEGMRAALEFMDGSQGRFAR